MLIYHFDRNINDARHLCTRLWTDEIKGMSRGFSGAKQVLNFSSTRNRGRVSLILTTETERLLC